MGFEQVDYFEARGPVRIAQRPMCCTMSTTDERVTSSTLEAIAGVRGRLIESQERRSTRRPSMNATDDRAAGCRVRLGSTG